MTSTEDIRPAPARARSDLDRLYAALPVDVDVPLARVVEATLTQLSAGSALGNPATSLDNVFQMDAEARRIADGIMAERKV